MNRNEMLPPRREIMPDNHVGPSRPGGGPGGPGSPGGSGRPGGPGPRPLPELPEVDFSTMTLDWAQYQDNWSKSPDGKYYALRFVYFETKIESPHHQYMNIFVPTAYLNEDGTVNEEGVCGNYTARTAPVILQNECSGWMSSLPGDVNESYMDVGFVYVCSGARSRGLENRSGKAPTPCVDLKAAVRMLRLHDAFIPGNKDRIISCGTSGGGQMSSIFGATGNMPEYYPWLYEFGAAGIEKTADGQYTSSIPDHVYGCQCYCPIADINNADLAYAWMRVDVGETGAVIGRERAHLDFSPFQLALQEDEARYFCTYINSLNLRDEDGNELSFAEKDGLPDPRSGSYYERILKNISDSLNAWLRDKVKPDGTVVYTKHRPFGESETFQFDSVDAYLDTLEYLPFWLKKNEDGTYSVTDLRGFLCGTNLCRNKNIPGFDTFHNTAENNAFGSHEEIASHYSMSVATLLRENYDRYKTLEGFADCDVDDYIAQADRQEVQRQVELMNATHILLDVAAGKRTADFARYWRTRNGTADEHTSFSIAYNLCLAAHMAGAEAVDYSLVWNAPHGTVDGDGTGSFISWVNAICTQAEAKD